jgi:hypothetical protein
VNAGALAPGQFACFENVNAPNAPTWSYAMLSSPTMHLAVWHHDFNNGWTFMCDSHGNPPFPGSSCDFITSAGSNVSHGIIIWNTNSLHGAFRFFVCPDNGTPCNIL